MTTPTRACLSNSPTCCAIIPCEECWTALTSFVFGPSLVAGDAKAKEMVEGYLAKSSGPLDWREVQKAYAEGFFETWTKSLDDLEQRAREALQVTGEASPIANVDSSVLGTVTPSVSDAAPKNSSSGETPQEPEVQSIAVASPGEAATVITESPKGKKNTKKPTVSNSTVTNESMAGVENGKG